MRQKSLAQDSLELCRYFKDHLRKLNHKNLEISVLCDIDVFTWLMSWVKGHAGDLPTPELSNTMALPVLISSHFLQMDALLEQCLQYIASNLVALALSRSDITAIDSTLLHSVAKVWLGPALQTWARY